jgi:hypothetical protein
VPASRVIPFASDLEWSTLGGVPEMLQSAYGSLTEGLGEQPGQFDPHPRRHVFGGHGGSSPRQAAGHERAIHNAPREQGRSVREIFPTAVDTALELVGTHAGGHSALDSAARSRVLHRNALQRMDVWVLRTSSGPVTWPFECTLDATSGGRAGGAPPRPRHAARSRRPALPDRFIGPVTQTRPTNTRNQGSTPQRIPTAHRYQREPLGETFSAPAGSRGLGSTSGTIG